MLSSKIRNLLEKRVDALEVELEEAQQYSRRTNVLVHGLSEEKDKETDKKVLGIFKEKLGLKDLSDKKSLENACRI